MLSNLASCVNLRISDYSTHMIANGGGVRPLEFIARIGTIAFLAYASYAAGYANAERVSGQGRVPGEEKARANYDGLTRTERVTSAAK